MRLFLKAIFVMGVILLGGCSSPVEFTSRCGPNDLVAECFEIDEVADASCNIAGAQYFQGKPKRIFLENDNPRRDVRAVLTRTISVYGEGGLQSQETSPEFEEVISARSGNRPRELTLSCNVAPSLNPLEHYQINYDLVSACYTDDPACQPPPALASVAKSCEAQCADGDASCLKFDLQNEFAGNVLADVASFIRAMSDGVDGQVSLPNPNGGAALDLSLSFDPAALLAEITSSGGGVRISAAPELSGLSAATPQPDMTEIRFPSSLTTSVAQSGQGRSFVPSGSSDIGVVFLNSASSQKVGVGRMANMTAISNGGQSTLLIDVEEQGCIELSGNTG